MHMNTYNEPIDAGDSENRVVQIGLAARWAAAETGSTDLSSSPDEPSESKSLCGEDSSGPSAQAALGAAPARRSLQSSPVQTKS